MCTFFRSLPEKKLYSVSGAGKLAMIQTYAGMSDWGVYKTRPPKCHFNATVKMFCLSPQRWPECRHPRAASRGEPCWPFAGAFSTRATGRRAFSSEVIDVFFFWQKLWRCRDNTGERPVFVFLVFFVGTGVLRIATKTQLLPLLLSADAPRR